MLRVQLPRLSRPFLSRSSSTAFSPEEHSIFISESTNPHFNLTFEDWLFRCRTRPNPLLFIYRNQPCVVIGRNQNPWKEVNVNVAQRAGLRVIRRQSGGGTVYHDLGNTNYSIHLPREEFDRKKTANTVLRAVQNLGVDAVLNCRNDICVGPDKHVSGSAYKIVRERAYHHGTMLISTKLDELRDVLHAVDAENIVSKGVASVPSPVRNLQEFEPLVTHEAFVTSMIANWREAYKSDEPVCRINATDFEKLPYIRDEIQQLYGWEWTSGQTPEFTHTISVPALQFDEREYPAKTIEIAAKHGLITACDIYYDDFRPQGGDLSVDRIEEISKELIGQMYGFADFESQSVEDHFMRSKLMLAGATGLDPW